MKDKTTLFREKAATYLCCFCDQCPLHERCLRYEVGSYIDPRQHLVTSISPHYAPAAAGTCEYFRDNQLRKMPLGMTHFYDDMPHRIERAVKNQLIGLNCRATYYKYHRGDRPINPDFLTDIQSACSHAGWTQPLHFDSEVEDYAW